MIKNKFKKSLALGIAVISVTGGSVLAFTDSSSSDIKIALEQSDTKGAAVSWITVDAVGKKYKGRPSAVLSGSSVYGKQETQTSDGSSAVRNSMASHCNLYNDTNGVIVKTKDWTYNSTASKSVTAQTPSITTKGTYRAQGTSKGMGTDNKYVTKWCGQSTIEQIRSLEISEVEKQSRINLYNEKGMVKAQGVNNVIGYVKEADLYDEENQPKTLEEAETFLMQRAKSNEQYRMIPLYDTDGETVIGEYRIDF